MTWKSIVLALSLGLTAGPALAAEQTVTLKVPGMFCASCPFIVKSALSKVKGVHSVKTSLADHTAVVVYDDALTNLDALTSATKNAGYDSKPVTGSSS